MNIKSIFLGALFISISSFALASTSALFLLCKSESHGEKWHLISGPHKTIPDCDKAADRHRQVHNSEYATVQCSWRTQEKIDSMLLNGSLVRWSSYL